LVRAARGAIFDVAVDIRKGSSTFGEWAGYELNDENHRQLYVPPDFAHGFLVLSKIADVIYKCTDYYHPESEAGISWDDPDIGIEWPRERLKGMDVIVSAKDSKNPQLTNQNLLPD
jgi:dTDP-4-dehydrorhamnose 3,5-epimerase